MTWITFAAETPHRRARLRLVEAPPAPGTGRDPGL